VLGSANEADDAVQEAWLRLQRTDGIDNLGGWLTTVVSRVCLDMLRSRSSRREDSFTDVADEPATVGDPGHPEFEAELAARGPRFLRGLGTNELEQPREGLRREQS
jgi:RNA polymerase sigma-70 factor (ECF subfamily)